MSKMSKLMAAFMLPFAMAGGAQKAKATNQGGGSPTKFIFVMGGGPLSYKYAPMGADEAFNTGLMGVKAGARGLFHDMQCGWYPVHGPVGVWQTTVSGEFSPEPLTQLYTVDARIVERFPVRAMRSISYSEPHIGLDFQKFNMEYRKSLHQGSFTQNEHFNNIALNFGYTFRVTTVNARLFSDNQYLGAGFNIRLPFAKISGSDGVHQVPTVRGEINYRLHPKVEYVIYGEYGGGFYSEEGPVRQPHDNKRFGASIVFAL